MIPQIPAAGNAGQQEVNGELGSSGVQRAPRYPAPPENSLESIGIHPQNELGGSQPPLAGRRPFPGIPRESCVAWTPLLEVLLRKDEPAADPRSSLVRLEYQTSLVLPGFHGYLLLFQHPLMSNLFLPIPPAPESGPPLIQQEFPPPSHLQPHR